MRNNIRKPPARSSHLVKSLYDRLFKHYGPQHWWPADSAWEMMVGAILTQNTAWTNVEKALANLRSVGVHRCAPFPSPKTIASMPCHRLARLIRPSGYFRQKAKRIQAFAREMQKDPAFFQQLVSPSFRRKPESRAIKVLDPGLHRGDVSALRQRLLSLHGIGPETADSILLYAGGYPIFVVDAYTRRLGQRMGLFETNDYNEIQAFFQNAMKQVGAQRCAPTYNEFHALIVAHAKAVCTSREPLCSECPIKSMCLFGKLSSSRRKPGSRAS